MRAISKCFDCIVWNCVDVSVLIPGIYRDKTMGNKLIFIPSDDKQNKPLCRLKLLKTLQVRSNQTSFRVST